MGHAVQSASPPADAEPLRSLVHSTPGLLTGPVLMLYALGALLMGAFVAVFNALGFRLEDPPYLLSTGAAGSGVLRLRARQKAKSQLFTK